ncbi:MAG: autotransporter domain-containing protein, partial [Abditibacteriaceae bacterium]
LIYQNTSINDVTLTSDNTQFSSPNLNAVTGRFGLRLYRNPKDGEKFLPWLRVNLWHTFSGDAKISSLGSTVGTPIGGTSAELQAGFTMGPKSNGGWNVYASGGYLFALSGAEYSGWRGTLGLRKGW